MILFANECKIYFHIIKLSFTQSLHYNLIYLGSWPNTISNFKYKYKSTKTYTLNAVVSFKNYNTF